MHPHQSGYIQSLWQCQLELPPRHPWPHGVLKEMDIFDLYHSLHSEHKDPHQWLPRSPYLPCEEPPVGRPTLHFAFRNRDGGFKCHVCCSRLLALPNTAVTNRQSNSEHHSMLMTWWCFWHQWNKIDLKLCRTMLELFAGASGLLTNINKCHFTPIRCSDDQISLI